MLKGDCPSPCVEQMKITKGKLLIFDKSNESIGRQNEFLIDLCNSLARKTPFPVCEPKSIGIMGEFFWGKLKFVNYINS